MRPTFLALALVLACSAPPPLTPAAGPPAAPGIGRLTLADLYGPNAWRARGFGPAHWLEDGGYTLLEPAPEEAPGQDLVRYGADDGERSVLVSAAELVPEGAADPLAVADHAWSADASKLLVFTNTRRVWRYETRGDWWVLDRSSGRLAKLGGDAPEASLQFAKFSPQGDRVAYVRENDIYVEDLADGAITRLTRDGSRTTINGTFDWAYEEEFDVRDGFRWSPDGSRIAYWQLDAEGVRDFLMIDNLGGNYAHTVPVQYPKAGERNSACRLGVVSAAGGATTWLAIEGDPRENYLPGMEWIPGSDQLLVQQLNRRQNRNRVMIADGISGAVRTLFVEQDACWVEFTPRQIWTADGRVFTWPSERDGWRHVWLVDRETGEARCATPGDYDVVEVSALDPEGGWLYFIASPDDPRQRSLYRTSLTEPGPPVRVTPQDRFGDHTYQTSPRARWAFHTRSAFGVPPSVELVRLPSHTSLATLLESDALEAGLAGLAAGEEAFFRVDVGGGVELDAWRMLPPDFDPDRRWPLLIYVYGEPWGSTVRDRWDGRTYLWHRYLAQQGYVVMSIDNRGTPPPRGRAWRKSIYGQIGVLAAADQAAALREILARFDWIDPARVGVWGWSGGGSMTLNALFRYPDLYRAGIAVAAVSDQHLYDSIYTERYMGLLPENEARYRAASPVSYADRLEGQLLLVHGTHDDNVHYQNFEVLVDALVAAGKPFEMMAYPNRSHGIWERANTSLHLRTTMARFLRRALPPGPTPAAAGRAAR